MKPRRPATFALLIPSRLPAVSLLLVLVAALGPFPRPASAGLVTDPYAVYTEPQVPAPGYLLPFVDPTFGNTLTRSTGDPGTSIGTVRGTWGLVTRHVYSKQQPWSSDGSLMVIENRGGSPSMLFLDGSSFQPKPGPCAGSLYDYRWHPSPTHPHEMVNVDGAGTTLSWYDVVACATTRSWSLPITSNYGIGSGEGNPSNDGRFVAIASDTQMLIVDMDPQPPFAPYPYRRIGPPVTISDCGSSSCAIDWVSVSASGRYAVVNYDGDYPRVFDIDPQTLALTPHVYPGATPECLGHDPANGFILDLGHADFALNPFDANADVLVGQRSSGCPSSVNGQPMGGVVMVRLRDGFVTMLTDPENEAFPHHISTRNLDRPGWAYVSYYPSSGQRFSDEVVAVKMDGSKAVERLAHMHSDIAGCYRCEPHAVPDRAGNRVVFASNWAWDCGLGCDSTSEVHDIVVALSTMPTPTTASPVPETGPAAFALGRVTPNPARTPFTVSFSLADPGAARIELLDVAGRQLLRRDLGEPGAGPHQAALALPDGLRSGVYWLRLTQGARNATRAVVVTR